MVQSVTYLAGYLLMIVNGFGFLLLCKEKDDQKMALLATIDSLTGLVNRRAFFERTDSARLLATRLRSPIALMMIDIDHFKRLNDRFGHATGDEALCVFAATAQQALRDHDIMGRLGGEEFALVLPGTDLEGALQAAERLRQRGGRGGAADQRQPVQHDGQHRRGGDRSERAYQFGAGARRPCAVRGQERRPRPGRDRRAAPARGRCTA